MYCDGFEDINDILREFSADKDALDGATLLMGVYDTPPYEGYAFVLYEKDGKLYEVNGSHCSCYGLEGQWEPEETTVEALSYRIKKGHFGYPFDSDAKFKEELQKIILKTSL